MFVKNLKIFILCVMFYTIICILNCVEKLKTFAYPLNQYSAFVSNKESDVYSNRYFPYIPLSFTPGPKNSQHSYAAYETSFGKLMVSSTVRNIWELEPKTKNATGSAGLTNYVKSQVYDNLVLNKGNAVDSSNTVEVFNISCDDGIDGYIKADIKTKSDTSITPIFDDAMFNFSQEHKCKMESSKVNKIVVNIARLLFETCGVKYCVDSEEPKYLCLKLRYPVVQGLKLPEDATLTLRCRLQEQMASHTQKLGLSVNAAALSRNMKSNNEIVTGGATNLVRCHLQAFKRGSQGFTSPLRNGEMVTFGDEILLRITIDHDNVWRWSRLSDVWLSKEDDTNNTIQLISHEGCTVPKARPICPNQSKQLGPFHHTLLIRAPMFADSGTESSVNLNVRVFACRSQTLCARHCERTTRSLAIQNKSIYNENLNQYETRSNNSRLTKSNLKIDNENLTYLSDGNKVVDGNTHESHLNLRNKGIGKVIFNDRSIVFDRDEVKHGKQADRALNGDNYVRRPRREARGMNASVDSVAILTFIVIQDERRVTDPATNKTADNYVAIYAVIATSTVVLTLLISLLVFCYKNCNIYWRLRKK